MADTPVADGRQRPRVDDPPGRDVGDDGPRSNGATPERRPAAADNPAVVDVVFAETGTADGNVADDGISFAFDQYFVGTLTVTKTAR